MTDTILTKFAIGSEKGMDTIRAIGAAAVREKYAGKVSEDQLEAFVKSNFNNGILHVEMNSMANQYLVVYSDGEPAGYARITSEGERPTLFDKKTVIRVADFYVLKKFNDIQIKKSLFEKCLSVCKMQQIIWIREYDDNPDLDFFEKYGFVKNKEIKGLHELGLGAVYLVKEKHHPVLQNKQQV